MFKTLLAAATAVAAISSPAFAKDAGPERSFTRDGQTYVYTVVSNGKRVVISGRHYPSGSDFELIVRGDRITGVSGGQPVSFKVPNAQAKLAPTALASR